MKRKRSHLLIDEYPLQVLPTIALAVGLNEGIFLQQLHYWINIKIKSGETRHCIDGHWWVYNSYREWHQQMPWWSERTIRRIIDELRDDNIIIVSSELGNPMDRRLWYTINYDRLDEILAEFDERFGDVPNETNASGQPDHMEEDRVSRCIIGRMSTSPYAETSTENTTESGADAPESINPSLARKSEIFSDDERAKLQALDPHFFDYEG